jgi:rhamnulokinase
VNGTTRFLKNVMGLWMLQCCRRAWAVQHLDYGHSALLELAENGEPFCCLVDPDHESFLRTGDMPAAIAQFCAHTHQPAPKSPGAFTRTILESLAFKYRVVLSELEELTGKRVEQIRVIGGGSKNRLLNQFTANATGKTVVAGSAEATALGNVAVQMLRRGRIFERGPSDR